LAQFPQKSLAPTWRSIAVACAMHEETTMKLYYSPGACSLAPHISLRESGVAFQLEQVDLKAKKTKSGADYLAINPKGVVPTLALDDGDVLTEAAVVVQFIADQAPNTRLAPPFGTRERYHVAEWLNYIATELHKGFSPLFKPDTPDAYRNIVHRNLAKQFDYVDLRLTGRTYLTGETFTVADAYLFTILNWTRVLKIDLTAYLNVSAFMTEVAARPKVREAMQAEGLKMAA
jgi:glutathione S-transferase